MIIRKNQQRRLALNLFLERLKKHWLDNFAHRFSAVPADQLTRLAEAALAEAQSKGIEKEDDVVVYADLCLASGAGFASKLSSGGRPHAL